MDDAELLRRVHTCLIAEAELWGSGSGSAYLERLPGVIAAVSPAAPDRSLFNCVVPDSLASLEAAYPKLAASFADAGVRAFTVWVGPGDRAMADFLAARGHKLDSRPAAMAAAMSELAIPEAGDLDWEATRDLGLLARINDQAYGFPPPAFEAALTSWPADDGWRGYVARADGRPAACAIVYESPDGDCGVTGVASLPDARGKNLAGRLLGRALAEARTRGATSTSLQASPLGRPVYAKMGYRDLGEMGMWEHRVS
ncbi:MAG: GNAT family N-acetyltransferase [Polyangiaceae bacterium]|nr:GNAT family N-acetyltransferase [Polyangiaceae bacterium]MCE7892803.1 GNAT family N-acetyltransferase [Sorangiineae bacterium PRO1]MCL4753948.1 GNAT family N-acetyltransferase [Myxococcales bacterium]